jgi:polysaccharide export outer membrane protein
MTRKRIPALVFAALLAAPAVPAAAQSSSGAAPRGAPALVPSPAAAPRAAAATASTSDTLGAGDSIRVTVFQNPDLTTEGRLSDKGTLMMPLIGEVRLQGMSATQAAARITDQLKKGNYILNPQVTVALTQVRSRQVSVLGQVVRPGKYALEEANPKLTDVLALAGGIGPTGSEQITITQAKGNKRTVDLAAMMRTGDLKTNYEVQNGDTIYVDRAPTFYIHGEVQRAGNYRLEQNMTVMQALSMGGGITLRGTQRGMKIHRKDANGNLQQINAKPTDPLQPDDVIFVKESFF